MSSVFSSAEKTKEMTDNKEKFVYKGDDYKIEYIIKDKWDGGYKVNINIENESDEAIRNWEMTIIVNGGIDSIWDAKIDCQNDKSYTIIGNNYNQKIGAKQSVSFGMIVKSDEIVQPDINFIISKKMAVDSDKCLINYSISSDWSSGFVGEFTMENKSGGRINSWCIEFDMDNIIDNIWNAEIIEHKDKHYLIGCTSYNQNIEADCSVQFGFTCNNGKSCNEPKNIVLSNYTPGKDDRIDETDEKEEIDVSQITEYAAIKYKAGNCAESVVDDLEFVNFAPDDLDIKWETSDESVVKTDGTIIRGDEDKFVTITAKIEYENEVYTKTFPVTIKKINSLDANSLEDLSLSQLEKLNKDDEDYETEVSDFGYIESIYGNYSDVKVDSYETALMSLYNIKSAIGIDDPFSELQVRKVSYDETGYIFKFEQVYNGMRVFGNSLTISADENGKTDYFCSDYFPIDSEINTIPVYSRENAIDKLKQEGYKDIVSDYEDLMILNYYGKCAIVWEFMCQKSDRWDEYEVLVDARTGDIDYINEVSDDLIQRTKTKGKDLLGETRSFFVKEKSMNIFWDTIEGPFYFLEDKKRKIGVYDAEGTHETKGKEIIWNTDNQWSKTEVSAMANMEEVYDFYKEKLNRISYNDAWSRMAGKKIKVYINTDIEDNAVWDKKTKCIFIGEGTWETFKSGSLAIEKDILAHEFTHAVVQDETSLSKISCGTPKIINEAYADIFSCYFDKNWKIGEEV